MARRKRSSESLDRANQRADNLESIDPSLDLGNGKTLAGYKSKIDALQTKLDNYNALLSQIDAALQEIETDETTLDDETEAMLEAVGVKFGKRSLQYKNAGGTSKSERKHASRNGSTNKTTAA
jgi:hypothetical protein